MEPFLTNSNFQLWHGFVNNPCYKHLSTFKMTVNKLEHVSQPKQKHKSKNEQSRKAYSQRMEQKLVQQFQEQKKRKKIMKNGGVSENTEKF